MRLEDKEYYVNKQCPIIQVLDICGIKRQQGSKAVQTRCPFHKGGMEGKWSARAYEDTNLLWCFTEDKQYRPLDIIRISKGLDLEKAIGFVESICKIDYSVEYDRGYVAKDKELEALEFRLKRLKGKVGLIDYRRICYAITKTYEDDIGQDVRKLRLTKISEAVDILRSKII